MATGGKDPYRASSFGDHEAGHRGRLRILIVEDEAIAAMDLESILLDLGHEVVGIAATKAEAVDLAQRTLPDLVLMDIRLADGSNGIEAAIQIRRQLDRPSIFVSAHVDELTVRRTAEAKPLGFVAKPYHETQIRKLLLETEQKLRGDPD